MKTIEIDLTRGYKTLIDESDFAKVSQYKWRACVVTGGVYAVTWMRINNKGSHVYLHRYLLDFPVSDVDHENRNTLDNRRANLRIATKSQNQFNKNLNKNNSSGFKGVSFNKAAQKYKAYIKHNRKLLYLGLFSTAEEAAGAYNEKAKELFGEFAKLNEVK